MKEIEAGEREREVFVTSSTYKRAPEGVCTIKGRY